MSDNLCQIQSCESQTESVMIVPGGHHGNRSFLSVDWCDTTVRDINDVVNYGYIVSCESI